MLRRAFLEWESQALTDAPHFMITWTRTHVSCASQPMLDGMQQYFNGSIDMGTFIDEMKPCRPSDFTIGQTMAKRNSSEMQTGNAEGQARRPKKGASFVGAPGLRASGPCLRRCSSLSSASCRCLLWWGCHSSNGMAWARPSSLEGSTGPVHS